MAAYQDSTTYKIWGVDDVMYGPVELPALISWVKEERVTAETWIFNEASNRWQIARAMLELKMFFDSSMEDSRPNRILPSHLSINELPLISLRRIRSFVAMRDDQLERFLEFMEVVNVRQFAEVVKQGDPGDAMYLVLDGEVRVRLMISGKETLLATLAAGDFFGEIALFDHGPRSADVLANRDSILLRISAAAFQRLATEAPDLATPFLLAMGRTLTSRIRADNKRFRDSVAMVRAIGR